MRVYTFAKWLCNVLYSTDCYLFDAFCLYRWLRTFVAIPMYESVFLCMRFFSSSFSFVSCLLVRVQVDIYVLVDIFAKER